MGRPSNRVARRAQIVEAMARVVASDGVEGASIAKIAAEASLAPGLLHYHFASKREMVVALVTWLSAGLQARVELRADASPWGALDAIIDGYLALDEDAEPVSVRCWVALGAEALRHEAVAAIVQSVLGRQKATLAAALRLVLEHEGRGLDGLDDLSAILLCTIEGAYQLSVAAPDTLPQGFAAPRVRQLARLLVSAEPEEASC